MLKLKVVLLLLIIGITIIFSSCDYYTPVSLIKAPVIVNTAYTSRANLSVIAQEFLPKGAKLIGLNRIDGEKNVLSLDLDNDRSNEIIAFFRIDDDFQNGMIILKNQDGKWTKITEKEVQSSSISKVDFTNIISKDNKNLFVGYYMSSLAGSQYDVYTFQNGKLTENYLCNAERFEILNTPIQSDKGFVFAAWNQDWGDVQLVNIYKFDGKELTEAEDFYQSYLPDIMNYYKEVLQRYPNNLLIWYRITEAQVKGNDPEEALDSLDKVEELRAENPNIRNYGIGFTILRAEALIKMKRYDKGQAILDELIYKGENNLDNTDIKNSIYLPSLYLQKGKLYLALNKKDKAEEILNKALEACKQVYKNHNTEKLMDRDVTVQEIRNEMKKLKS